MIRRIVRDERGASLMLVAVFLVAILASADVGMFYTAKAQAQNAADSGALAGARALIQAPNNDPVARATAKTFGDKHQIIKQPVSIDSAADVVVDLVNKKVTVTARRTTARG